MGGSYEYDSLYLMMFEVSTKVCLGARMLNEPIKRQVHTIVTMVKRFATGTFFFSGCLFSFSFLTMKQTMSIHPTTGPE
jgi:uncharacterized membrane protein YgdD (TMEM256/DUF423 family)